MKFARRGTVLSWASGPGLDQPPAGVECNNNRTQCSGPVVQVWDHHLVLVHDTCFGLPQKRVSFKQTAECKMAEFSPLSVAILMGILPYVETRVMIWRDLRRCTFPSRGFEKGRRRLRGARSQIGRSRSQFDRFFSRWHKQKFWAEPHKPGHQGPAIPEIIKFLSSCFWHFMATHLFLLDITGPAVFGAPWWEIIFPFPAVSP